MFEAHAPAATPPWIHAGTRKPCRLALEGIVDIDAPAGFFRELAQHLHLDACYGRGRWRLVRGASLSLNARNYDKYVVRLNTGEIDAVWFDVTERTATREAV